MKSLFSFILTEFFTIPKTLIFKILFFSILLSGHFQLSGQIPLFSWVKPASGAAQIEVNDAEKDKNGNIYTIGSFTGNPDFEPSFLNAVVLNSKGGNRDIFICKHNSSGAIVWAKEISDTGDNRAVSLCLDSAGNIYITGVFSKSADFNPGSGKKILKAKGNSDIFLLKLNPLGELIWIKQFEAAGNADNPHVSTDRNGKLLLSGNFNDSIDIDPGSNKTILNNKGSESLFIAKMDTSGNLFGHRQFDAYGQLKVYDIKWDKAGNLYLNGLFTDSTDFDPGIGREIQKSAGKRDIFLLKLDSSANYIWVMAYEGKGDEYNTGLTIDKGLNIYLSGTFSSTIDMKPSFGYNPINSAGLSDVFIQKLDTAGNIYWHKRIGGIGSEGINDIETDSAGNIFCGGFFSDAVDFDPNTGKTVINSNAPTDGFTLKLSSAGIFIWVKSINGNLHGSVLELITDLPGNIVSIGEFSGRIDANPGSPTQVLVSLGGLDIFIQKLNGSGQYVWSQNVSATSDAYFRSVKSDNHGNIYVAGYVDGIVNFEPGTGNFILSAVNNGSDIFVAKYRKDGKLLWVKSIGSTGDDHAFSIDTDDSGNIYFGGVFNGKTDFDPGPGVVNLTISGSNNGFLCKLDSNGNFGWVLNLGAVYALDIDPYGDIIITGNYSGTFDFDPGSGVYNMSTPGGYIYTYVAKYNRQGKFKWARQQSGYSNLSTCIKSDNKGNCYINGHYHGNLSNSYIFKMDKNGNLEWQKRFEITFPIASTMDVDSRENLYLTGTFKDSVDFDPGPGTYKLYGDGPDDIALICLDSAGNLNWAYDIGNSGYETGPSVAIDRFDNIYLSGSFQGTVDFDPGNSVSAKSSSFHNNDFFILKLDSSGNYLWVISNPGYASQHCYNTYVDPHLNIITSGVFYENTDFDHGPELSYVVASGSPDGYVQKIIQCSHSSSVLNIKACDKFEFHGKIFTSSGTHFDTIVNYSGCDSIVKINLSIFKQSAVTNLNTTIQRGDSVFFDGYYIKKTGNYYDTLKNKFGCDSVIHLNLNVQMNVLVEINAKGCFGTPFSFNGKSINASGTYYDTLNTYNGFDSTVRLNIVFYNPTYSVLNQNICEGTYFDFKGNLLSQPGTYTDTITNANGCDSVIFLVLSVLPKSESTINKTLCRGESVIFNDKMLSEKGTYFDTLTNYTGCDSICRLNLNIDSMEAKIFKSGKILNCNNDSVTYQWIQCDSSNKSIPGQNGKSFQSTLPGIFAVVIDNGQCTDTSDCIIIDTSDLSVNSDFKSESLIRVYPNPGNGSFNIKSFTDGILIIYDLSGKSIYNETLESSALIYFKDISPGIYYYLFLNDENKSCGKIVVY